MHLDVNFCKDHRDKTKVQDPLAVENLISSKLNSRRKFARLITQHGNVFSNILKGTAFLFQGVTFPYCVISLANFRLSMHLDRKVVWVHLRQTEMHKKSGRKVKADVHSIVKTWMNFVKIFLRLVSLPDEFHKNMSVVSFFAVRIS